jgi:hypothetical protein
VSSFVINRLLNYGRLPLLAPRRRYVWRYAAGTAAALAIGAKTKWEFGFVSGLERIGGFGGQADLLTGHTLRNRC